MAVSFESLKRELGRNRKRTSVLAALTVVMGALILRAYLQMSARPAAASPIAQPAAMPEDAADAEAGVPAADADKRLALSKSLWSVLRQVRGADAATAFKFDPSYFPRDPSRPAPAPVDAVPDPAPHAAARPLDDDETVRRARMAAVREQAKDLVVRSTVVNTGSKPVAVVNDRIMSVGDTIDGFVITAIRAREVEFKKDDVTLPIKMVDMPRGQ
ncbi:MAG TPA: hypothetical protein VHQ47_08005 [Phycisphaerae bacterium]|jgi:hypothetical protein|nr:hypothetical protein [Phycisphaerae bacterium]